MCIIFQSLSILFAISEYIHRGSTIRQWDVNELSVSKRGNLYSMKKNYIIWKKIIDNLRCDLYYDITTRHCYWYRLSVQYNLVNKRSRYRNFTVLLFLRWIMQSVPLLSSKDEGKYRTDSPPTAALAMRVTGSLFSAYLSDQGEECIVYELSKRGGCFVKRTAELLRKCFAFLRGHLK